MGVPQDRSGQGGHPDAGASPIEIEMSDNTHLLDNAVRPPAGGQQNGGASPPSGRGRGGPAKVRAGYEKVSAAESAEPEGLDEPEGFGLPEPASGRRQLKAMLWRQYLFKARL